MNKFLSLCVSMAVCMGVYTESIFSEYNFDYDIPVDYSENGNYDVTYFSVGTTTISMQHVGMGLRSRRGEGAYAFDASINACISPVISFCTASPLLGFTPRFAYLRYTNKTLNSYYAGLSTELYSVAGGFSSWFFLPNVGIVFGSEKEDTAFSQFQINLAPLVVASIGFEKFFDKFVAKTSSIISKTSESTRDIQSADGTTSSEKIDRPEHIKERESDAKKKSAPAAPAPPTALQKVLMSSAFAILDYTFGF